MSSAQLRFLTLFSKLSVIIFGLCFLLGLLYTAWMIRTSRLYLEEVTQRLNINLARHLAAERILMPEGRVDKAAAEETFRTLMAINRNIEIYLLDPAGRIVAFSAAPGVVKRTAVDLSPIQAVLAGRAPPIYGDDPRHEMRRKVFSVTPLARDVSGQPLPAAAVVDGYLYVILVGDEFATTLETIATSRTLRAALWAVAAFIAVAAAVALLIVRWLTRRLTVLAREMQRFRESDFGDVPRLAFTDRHPRDEIDLLGVTFREMSERIVDQIGRLRDVDRMRRNLVANVSHDLRTPIASVHGYLETLLLKEPTLSADDRRRYQTAALKHTKALNEMIAELFELAKLEAREVDLRLEAFSLCELGQDVLQRFELASAARRITLDGQFGFDIPMVAGDIRLIERVLVNLVDNAIRHSPETGRVSLICQAQGDEVVVMVVDTGKGIAPADLSLIFERFHRSPADAAAEGAGLGLAIAKRIVELHGRRLTVTSTERGATFSFSLPTADAALVSRHLDPAATDM